MRIICISDTHGQHESVQLPDGDVLVHAGDITAHGSRDDYYAFIEWFSQQPHEHKIFIAGNHDTYLEEHPDNVAAVAKAHNVSYLNDSGVVLNNVRFWGSPITPRFLDWSFMRDPEDIDQHWALIPKATDVLITHGPTWGVLDEVERPCMVTENTGCPSLADRIKVVSPAYHIFGHIHECYGIVTSDDTTFLNVSTMNKYYEIQNKPVVVDVSVELNN